MDVSAWGFSLSEYVYVLKCVSRGPEETVAEACPY